MVNLSSTSTFGPCDGLVDEAELIQDDEGALRAEAARRLSVFPRIGMRAEFDMDMWQASFAEIHP